MRLASMQDEKNLVPYNQAAPQAQMMPQEQGMGQQFMDMAKQKAMSSVIDKGITTAMGSGAGSAGMAGMATAMPYVGMGLMGAKMLGLFSQGGPVSGFKNLSNEEMQKLSPKELEEYLKALERDAMGFEHGGFIGPLSPQYRSEGTKPDFLDLDKDGNKTEPMKEAAKEKKPQYNAEGTTEMVQEAMPMPQVPMMVMPMPMQPVPQMQTMPSMQPMSPVMSEIDKMRAEYLKSLGV